MSVNELRAKLLNAVREALEVEVRRWPAAPNYYGPGVYRMGVSMDELSEIAVDTVCEFLSEHADEWWTAWFDSDRPLYTSAPIPKHLPQLLAVLRTP